jgi:hypothetical protein
VERADPESPSARSTWNEVQAPDPFHVKRVDRKDPAMTDPGERLRSSLAADQASPAEFDSPIAMEALRATRVLHAADQEPFPAPGRIRVITVANQKGGVG